MKSTPQRLLFIGNVIKEANNIEFVDRGDVFLVRALSNEWSRARTKNLYADEWGVLVNAINRDCLDHIVVNEVDTEWMLGVVMDD